MTRKISREPAVPARRVPLSARTARVLAAYRRSVMGNHARAPVVFVRGRGSWLWDADGRRYLDFFPGFGVGALGHCHPAVVRAVRRQAGRLIHVPNTYHHPWQGELARALLGLAGFSGRVFFCNSGAEANEAAIKLARRYFQVVRGQRRTVIVTVRDAFHGRTLGALAATGQRQYVRGFAPIPAGFRRVPLNDLKAARRAVDGRTCAVLLEPILGEGGLQAPTRAYLRGLRAITRARGALLMFDEVQTGGGRTGAFFAFRRLGVVPDAVTLAKPLAGGLPMGALLARRAYAGALAPGSHASTFGGSPLVCAAALAAVKLLGAPRFLAGVRRKGRLLRAGLAGMAADHPRWIASVRGLGLMCGLGLRGPAGPVADACRKRGLLVNATHGTVLRVYPPLTASAGEIRAGLRTLDRVFRSLPAP